MAETSEYYWVEKNLPQQRCRIFNFGSTNDETIEKFTEKGYVVVGVDLIQDSRASKINGYEFHKGDFLEMEFDEKFKCIYAVSSIEHVGLETYGQKLVEDGDVKAVEKLYGMLKQGGILLFTVPYGFFPINPNWRVYNMGALRKLVDGYKHELKIHLATGEYFLQGWRKHHRLTKPPDVCFSPTVWLNPYIDAHEFYSIACIKIIK